MAISLSQREVRAIAHLRGKRHDSATCPICLAEREGIELGKRMAVRVIAEG